MSRPGSVSGSPAAGIRPACPAGGRPSAPPAAGRFRPGPAPPHRCRPPARGNPGQTTGSSICGDGTPFRQQSAPSRPWPGLLSARLRPCGRVLKKGASGRDPALRGSCKCSHISQYAALSKSPRVLADGLMLLFQHPVRASAERKLSEDGSRRNCRRKDRDSRSRKRPADAGLAGVGAPGGRAAAGYPMVFLMMPISFSGSKGLRTNATASLIA